MLETREFALLIVLRQCFRDEHDSREGLSA
jgi:hypothetical protein